MASCCRRDGRSYVDITAIRPGDEQVASPRRSLFDHLFDELMDFVISRYVGEQFVVMLTSVQVTLDPEQAFNRSIQKCDLAVRIQADNAFAHLQKQIRRR